MTSQIGIARTDLFAELIDEAHRGRHGSGLRQLHTLEQLASRSAEQIGNWTRMTATQQGGVDAILERGAVTHQVQPPARSFPFAPDLGRGQPDGRHQVTAAELGEHPGVDAISLAGKWCQPFDPLGVRHVDLPASNFALIVDEAGAVH